MTCSNNAILNVKAGLSKLIIILIVFLHFQIMGFSQNSGGADSLVRLVEAKSAHLIEMNGNSFRKVVGPATFLHNNTYLKCDTALWNVNTNIIDAIGNVEILQENTRLTSDRIEYVADENLAKFRGTLVQLSDKDGNVLNTNFLNYNTKDSIATFFNGAAMRSNDGNLIESVNGMYFSSDKLFTFKDSVAMFTDSVLVSTSQLDYHTDTDIAVFKAKTVAWRDSSILYANSGSFVRKENKFIFDRDGYILTREQELWADRLVYYKNTGNADLFTNIQVLDTVQKSICLAHRATYIPTPRRIELMEQPAVAMYTVENDVPDTLFLAADIILYTTKRAYEVDSLQIELAKERLRLSSVDPIAIHDKERKEAQNGQKQPLEGTVMPKEGGNSVIKGKDTSRLHATDDSSMVFKPLADSLTLQKEQIIIPHSPDTTQIDFIEAFIM